jgi:hypothetical protein
MRGVLSAFRKGWSYAEWSRYASATKYLYTNQFIDFLWKMYKDTVVQALRGHPDMGLG